MRRDRVEALEHQLHASGDQIVDRRRAALVGHVHDVGAGHELEQLAADMAGRAVARRGVRELAGILLRVVDQLLDRLERRVGDDGEQQVAARHQRDRLEVALDVVGQLRHHVARDRERADRPHADACSRPARAFAVEIEPDGERAAGPVVDDDLLAELLAELRAENARHRVGGAAGGLRHDQPDRLVGKLGARRWRSEGEQAMRATIT